MFKLCPSRVKHSCTLPTTLNGVTSARPCSSLDVSRNTSPCNHILRLYFISGLLDPCRTPVHYYKYWFWPILISHDNHLIWLTFWHECRTVMVTIGSWFTHPHISFRHLPSTILCFDVCCLSVFECCFHFQHFFWFNDLTGKFHSIVFINFFLKDDE